MKLERKEIEKIKDLSRNFITIRDRISEVENKMSSLKSESLELVEKLKEQRELESEFVESLHLEYGSGKLDLTTMEWIKETENDK